VAGYDDVATAIVQGQRKMVGQVAIQLAQKAPGVSVDAEGNATITGDGAAAIDALVKEYSAITGQLGVRMCYQAAEPALKRHPDVTVPSFATFA
jgi:hypothetical protein